MGSASVVPMVLALPVGLTLTGRSMWSDGLAGRSLSAELGGTVAVETSADITVWLSSSVSSGIGSSFCDEGSMHSPQRVSFQSVKVPLCSLTLVSFTTTLHFPTPGSPLLYKLAEFRASAYGVGLTNELLT